MIDITNKSVEQIQDKFIAKVRKYPFFKIAGFKIQKN